jgi:hypothetical protein
MDVFTANFCRCCLTKKVIPSSLHDMNVGVFFYNNQPISFYDGYFETTGANLMNIHIQDPKICDFCIERLKSAFSFRKLCQQSNESLEEAHFFGRYEILENPIAPVVMKCEPGEYQYNDGEMVEQVEKVSTADTKQNFIQIKTEVEEMSFDTPTNEPQPTTATESLIKPKKIYQRFIANALHGKHNKKRGETDDKNNVPFMHQCKSCPEQFKCYSTLHAHKRIKHLNMPFICKVCSKEFPSQSALYMHNQKDHLRIRHDCKFCSKNFKTRNTLSVHVKASHQQVQFECKQCDKTFNRSTGLQYHMQTDHDLIRHECKICQKKFRGLQSLWFHSFEHRGFLPFNCQWCDKKTADKAHFKRHLQQMHHVKYDEQEHGYKEAFQVALSFVKT